MKRFHVHVSVKDLSASIRFYRTLFAAEPVVIQPDYAKWMLDDPRVNFAISTHRQPVGVNHLGSRSESDEELRGMRAQLEAADARMLEEKRAALLLRQIGQVLGHRSHGNRVGDLPHLGPHPGLWRGYGGVQSRRVDRRGRGGADRLLRSCSDASAGPLLRKMNGRADLQRPFFVHRQLGAQHLGRVALEHFRQR